IGIAPPGAGAGARRIDEDAIEADGVALHPFIARRGKRLTLHDANAGAPEALRRALEALFRDIAGNEMTAILHRGRERQGLAAGAGAEIDHAHAGPRIGEERSKLRALVLHLDRARFEKIELAERHALEKAQADRRQLGA